LFCDEEQQAKATRDPVAPAERSESAQHKVRTRTLDDGTPVHSFTTLLKSLSTIVRNTCRISASGCAGHVFHTVTTPSAQQQRAYELLRSISV